MTADERASRRDDEPVTETEREDYAALTRTACRLAREAGDRIMTLYRASVVVRTKDDGSPVTEADLAAHRVIVAGLAAAAPHIPIVSEEAAGVEEARAGRRFWLVDPLDGTREFIARTGDFSVNIALVDEATPALGVLHLPVRGETYFSDGRGTAWLADGGAPRAIGARAVPAGGPVVVASRAHLDPETERFIADRRPARIERMGGALKFGLLARGDADLYPRFGRTMEWDTAAGHAVLAAAGGRVRDRSGRELRYGKPGFENPSFIATGRG